MTLRTPHAYVMINGAQYPVISVEVTQCRTKNSDTFWCEIPLSLIGDITQNGTTAQVYMGNDGVADTLMFDGYVDHVDIGFQKQVVTLSGRDKVSKMIDKKTRKKWLNKTPGDIVNELGGDAGLKIQSDSIGSKAGKIYVQDFNAFIHETSDWSLIQRLADLFGMEAYCTLGTLYFKNLGETLPFYQINYRPPSAATYADSNVMNLSGRHNLLVSKGASVKVSSWNHKQKQAISAQAQSGQGPAYNYTYAGITQDQAQGIAKKRLKENTAHGATVAITMPGDVAMTARTNIQISGTGTSFDSTFETKQVEFRMDCGSGQDGDSEGFVMQIDATAFGVSSSS